MSFSQVIGQSAVKQQLAELLQHNRLSHALLFLGKEGSGALPLALAFAQYVVCEKANPKKVAAAPGPSLFGDDPAIDETSSVSLTSDNRHLTTDSCGVCPACLKAQQFVHPDIHYSYPTVTKKAGE